MQQKLSDFQRSCAQTCVGKLHPLLVKPIALWQVPFSQFLGSLRERACFDALCSEGQQRFYVSRVNKLDIPGYIRPFFELFQQYLPHP